MAEPIEIDVWQGEIAELEVDAVVVAASESLFMTAGAATSVKRHAGDEVERAAVEQGPIAPGTAVATSGGDLPAPYVIHAVAVGHDRSRRSAHAWSRRCARRSASPRRSSCAASPWRCSASSTAPSRRGGRRGARPDGHRCRAVDADRVGRAGRLARLGGESPERRRARRPRRRDRLVTDDAARRLAAALERRGLAVPARLLADAHRPLAAAAERPVGRVRAAARSRPPAARAPTLPRCSTTRAAWTASSRSSNRDRAGGRVPTPAELARAPDRLRRRGPRLLVAALRDRPDADRARRAARPPPARGAADQPLADVRRRRPGRDRARDGARRGGGDRCRGGARRRRHRTLDRRAGSPPDPCRAAAARPRGAGGGPQRRPAARARQRRPGRRGRRSGARHRPPADGHARAARPLADRRRRGGPAGARPGWR